MRARFRRFCGLSFFGAFTANKDSPREVPTRPDSSTAPHKSDNWRECNRFLVADPTPLLAGDRQILSFSDQSFFTTYRSAAPLITNRPDSQNASSIRP